MKNRITSFILIILFSSLFSSLYAQSPGEKATANCDTLIKQANQYLAQNAFEQVDSILQILKIKAEAIDYKKGQAEYFSVSGELKKIKGDLQNAYSDFEYAANTFAAHIAADQLSFIYNRLVYISYKLGNKPSCLKYADKALQLLNEVSTPLLKGTILHTLGTKEDAFGTPRGALNYNLRAKEYYALAKDTSKICIINYNIGLQYRVLSLIDSSSMFFAKNLEIANQRNDLIEQLYSYDALAVDGLELGDIEKTLQYLKEGIVLAEANEADQFSGRFKILMSKAHMRNSDLDAALLAAEKALDFLEEKNMAQAVFQAWDALTQIHEQRKEYDKMLHYIELQSDYLSKLDGRQMGKAACLAYKGNYYKHIKQPEKALTSFRQGIAIAKPAELNVLVSQIQMAMAEVFYTTEQADSMLLYINKSNNHDGLRQTNTYNSELESAYYRAYKLKGDFEKALIHHEKYLELRNENYLKDSRNFIAEERVKQNVEQIEEDKAQAEQAAALLNARNKMYAAAALGLLGILLVGGYFFTQLRKKQSTIESQNNQLQNLNDTKDKFFGIIAHDIRTPIIALSGVGNLMQHYLKRDDRPKLERLSTRVDNTAKQLSNLLDNLLNWALLQQGVIPYHPQKLSVKEVTDGIFDMFQNNAISKGVILESTIDASDDVYADESALNTILRNLIGNAIKYTPSGGKVTISSTTKDNKLFININDTGTGIAAERLEQLFSFEKKSMQGTEGEKGTGLGLNLVKELTAQNKGVLDVKSKLNEGSQFTIGLPIDRLMAG